MFSKLTNDKVLVEKVSESEEMQQTKSGLYVPTTTSNRNSIGYVVVVGMECKVVRKDNKVMFDSMAAKEIELDGTKFHMMREDAIIGVF